MATARDLIKGSLRDIGVLATGENPSSEEANDGLELLNQLLDSWSNERLIIYNIVRETFTLVANTQSYTIGSGATFNTSRPQKIENALIKDGDIEYPVNVVGLDEWAAITDKTTSSDLPLTLYCEGSYPNDTIYLWPVPSEANTLVLHSWKPLTQLSGLSTSLSLPPGYERALRSNLAIELCPQFGKEPSGVLMKIAMESKANIKRMNISEYLLDANPFPTKTTYSVIIGR